MVRTICTTAKSPRTKLSARVSDSERSWLEIVRVFGTSNLVEATERRSDHHCAAGATRGSAADSSTSEGGDDGVGAAVASGTSGGLLAERSAKGFSLVARDAASRIDVAGTDSEAGQGGTSSGRGVASEASGVD